MQVVLLAAGFGSRLGSLTQHIPKALVTVAGDPLLVHALRFARLLEPEDIVVVGGVGFQMVADEVARRALVVTLVENREFRDGNLVSLLSARRHLRGEFVLMNVDHIYRAPIAEVVRRTVGDVTAFIDTDRKLGGDDMKVERDGQGRVRRIAKTLETWDSGYVGMTRVPSSAVARYWQAADALLADEGRAVHVERVLARLALTDAPPCTADISGPGWLEVDTSDERAAAEAVVAGGSW
jgi:L-glutamine-phosphate cytidylyltransferase